MNRFRNYLLMAAGFAVLVMVVGVFSAGPAIAQAVRAALVSNVDDPGRIPYKDGTVFFGDCSSYCAGSFRKVLAGKRLVITNVTGYVSTAAPGGTGIIMIIDGARIPMIYSGFFNGQNSFGFNQQVLFFYDPGETPLTALYTSASVQGTNGEMYISGYLLDCTTAPCAAINRF